MSTQPSPALLCPSLLRALAYAARPSLQLCGPSLLLCGPAPPRPAPPCCSACRGGGTCGRGTRGAAASRCAARAAPAAPCSTGCPRARPARGCAGGQAARERRGCEKLAASVGACCLAGMRTCSERATREAVQAGPREDAAHGARLESPDFSSPPPSLPPFTTATRPKPSPPPTSCLVSGSTER